MNDAANIATVIGLGTGRCGTTSLTRLLESCGQTVAKHEGLTPLPWEPSQEDIDAAMDWWRGWLREGLQAGARFVADVAMHELAYVEPAIHDLPNVRVVAMWRPQVDTAMSWEQVLGKYKFLRKNDTTSRRRFPTYPFEETSYEAALLYWQAYQDRVDALMECYPDRVQRFGLGHTNELPDINTVEGKADLYDWIGLPQAARSYPSDCHHNQGIPA